MNVAIERIRSTRSYLLENIDQLNTTQLNEIPKGFNNNIIWNLGHLIAAQQGIVYTRSGLPTVLETSFLVRYRPGTSPEAPVDDAGVAHIKRNLLTSLDTFETDFANGIFTDYTPITTRYGVVLANIDDALAFLGFHEGLHSGVVISIQKLVGQ